MVTIMSLLRCAAIVVATAGLVGTAFAQNLPAQASTQNGGAGIRSGNITAVGETVPNPGASQSAGTTRMDRGIERRNDKIESSICKGC